MEEEAGSESADSTPIKGKYRIKLDSKTTFKFNELVGYNSMSVWGQSVSEDGIRAIGQGIGLIL